jgi:hypothetical protein
LGGQFIVDDLSGTRGPLQLFEENRGTIDNDTTIVVEQDFSRHAAEVSERALNTGWRSFGKARTCSRRE